MAIIVLDDAKLAKFCDDLIATLYNPTIGINFDAFPFDIKRVTPELREQLSEPGGFFDNPHAWQAGLLINQIRDFVKLHKIPITTILPE